MKQKIDFKKIKQLFYSHEMILVDPFETLRRNLHQINFNPEELSYIIRLGYDHSFYIYMYKHIIYGSLRDIKPENLDCIMSKEELEFLNNLPDRVTIYRYMTKKELKSQEFDCFWTLDENKAQALTERFEKSVTKATKIIHSMEIRRNDIAAYFNKKNEATIIYFSS